ncbi:hypothetical protein [Micromonospora sp. NPDC005220]|uniref:hypothetical protein n=1 Tax=Micromonospora sp. NPDC005220 TaxID=3155589 RepID=UPI0033A53667
MRIDSLPEVDEHTTVIAAEPHDVWPHLLHVVQETFDRTAVSTYARLVRAADPVASGPRPLTEGSTLPGFHVTTAHPARELTLRGSHRFSTYALRFRLEPVEPGRTRLRAETRAVFPGLAGGLYRQLLLRSGGHVLGVRRMLATVRRHATP